MLRSVPVPFHRGGRCVAVYDHLFSVWDLRTGTALGSVGSGATKTGFLRPLTEVNGTGATRARL